MLIRADLEESLSSPPGARKRSLEEPGRMWMNLGRDLQRMLQSLLEKCARPRGVSQEGTPPATGRINNPEGRVPHQGSHI